LDKELKNELRRDEIGDALQEAKGALARPEVVKPALAVIGLVLVLAGLYYGQKFRTASAESAFSRATEVYHAPVGVVLSAAPAAGETFKTSNEKYEKAKAMFDEVAKNHGSMAAGRRARYYSALCLIELGRDKEAEDALKEIAALRQPGAIEPAMARLRVAELVLRNGRGKDAAAFYKALIADEASGLPKDRLLFGFAESLESAGEKLEARRAYADLVNRHPQSPYAQDARQKMDALASL
jgi:outer membrane protein assembly factor BamD (BamD/ComL family)